MRVTALAAAAVCIGLLAGGVAAAQTWTDPQGRVVFDAPRGWATQRENVDTLTYVITATGAAECHVVSQPNGNEGRAANLVRNAGAEDSRFTADTWQRVLNALFPSVFTGNSASVISTSKETTGFWPIQRAEVQGPERVVHASMQIRPGFDLITACMTFSGTDSAERYDAFIRSVRHPNDATWQAEAAAAAPAPAPAPAQ